MIELPTLSDLALILVYVVCAAGIGSTIIAYGNTKLYARWLLNPKSTLRRAMSQVIKAEVTPLIPPAPSIPTAAEIAASIPAPNIPDFSTLDQRLVALEGLGERLDAMDERFQKFEGVPERLEKMSRGFTENFRTLLEAASARPFGPEALGGLPAVQLVGPSGSPPDHDRREPGERIADTGETLVAPEQAFGQLAAAVNDPAPVMLRNQAHTLIDTVGAELMRWGPKQRVSMHAWVDGLAAAGTLATNPQVKALIGRLQAAQSGSFGPSGRAVYQGGASGGAHAIDRLG